MFSFLKMALKAGFGLAAIGAALFFSIHKEWMKLDVFSQLTPEQTYNFFIYNSIAVFCSFVFLLIIHAASNRREGRTVSASHDSVAVSSSGKNNKITINKR